ncbi:TetR/AcrR family transcriptional regulator [Microbacterium karelineae]|uniref:TetR/AcrR family transcriptional regulator n=1 Tax=Microbacterium karelineae TaxID=2654283 RepID=UPI0012E9F4C3|nr:TetR/AcrR family transcriptional regulator [Microbacterium karelineae]
MNTRDRIVGAAADVMTEKGVAAATTREIARAAGCSEALLYKHFASKQELFVAVLNERMPPLPDPLDLVGAGSVEENLRTLLSALVSFYVESFPMAASIFGSPSLRDAHRESMAEMGAGPEGPALLVRAYLDAEVASTRISSAVDTRSLARALTGAALFEAFQAAYAGQGEVALVGEVAHRIVDAVTRGLARD